MKPRLGGIDRESSSAKVSLSQPAGGPSASAQLSTRAVIENETTADNLARFAALAHQPTGVAEKVTFTPQQQAQEGAAPARQPRLKLLLRDSASQASLECCQGVLTVTDFADACLLHVLTAAHQHSQTVLCCNQCLCFSVLHVLATL